MFGKDASSASRCCFASAEMMLPARKMLLPVNRGCSLACVGGRVMLFWHSDSKAVTQINRVHCCLGKVIALLHPCYSCLGVMLFCCLRRLCVCYVCMFRCFCCRYSWPPSLACPRMSLQQHLLPSASWQHKQHAAVGPAAPSGSAAATAA
jgi:hypothetical protein